MNMLYTTKATVVGGRDGKVTSDDGRMSAILSNPEGLGGDGGAGTSPEQLFAAAYSACFLEAMRLVAARKNIFLADDTTVGALIGLQTNVGGKGLGLDVELTAMLPGLNAVQSRAIVDEAHVVCPYSQALRGNVDVRITLLPSNCTTGGG